MNGFMAVGDSDLKCVFKYHLKSEGECIEETLRHGLHPNEGREMSIALAMALRSF